MTDPHPTYAEFLDNFKNKRYPSNWPIELCAWEEFKGRIGALELEKERLENRIFELERKLGYRKAEYTFKK